jgi:hypothetical protein
MEVPASVPVDAGIARVVPISVDAGTTVVTVDATPADPCEGPGDLGRRDDLTCADRKAWYRRIGWSSECEKAYDTSAIRDSAGITFHGIGGGRSLLVVVCTLGAYQGYANYFVLGGKHGGARPFEALRFRSYVSPRDGLLNPVVVTDLWGDAEFNDAHEELVVHNRYRGPGDCGLLTRYAFPGGHAVVVEIRAHPVCDGKETDPGKWPRVSPP